MHLVQRNLGQANISQAGHLSLSRQQERARSYARNLVNQTNRFSRSIQPLLRWLPEHATSLGLELSEDLQDECARRTPIAILSVGNWRLIQKAFQSCNTGTVLRCDDPVEMVCDSLGMDDLDRTILQFTIDYVTNKTIEDLWDGLCDAHGQRGQLLANPENIGLLIGITSDEIRKRLSAKGLLRSSGVLKMDTQGRLCVLERLVRVIREPAGLDFDPATGLLGAPQTTSLKLENFSHIAADVEKLRTILDGALQRSEAGVNILLYGEPGTGKTELAKALAASLNVPIRSVGEADEDNAEPMRGDRLAELCLAQRLAASLGSTILLFDEAEDLLAMERGSFAGDEERPYSKVFMHRLLECGQLPVIFTANKVSKFGAAILRRMACCVELRIPPAKVRTQLWENAARIHDISASSSEIKMLAVELAVAPALAQSAMRSAGLSDGTIETAKWALNGIMKAVHSGSPPVTEHAPEDFELDLISADTDLAALVANLTRGDVPQNISLLLSGPSGSGKSAFARYLAQGMGLPILVRRASDLFDKYIGETEKRIALAFAEAVSTGSFLIFDEVDSLIADRRRADKNWEVSQINEMLTWLERHPLPFCCTTNFADHLDEAAMRRFLIKAKFGFLCDDQVAVSFRRNFGVEAPSDLRAFDCLTPADFALVKRAAAITGSLGSPHLLVEALRKENMAKSAARRTPVGFSIA